MTHATAPKATAAGKMLIRRIDAHLRKRLGIFELWDDPRSQFRVSLGATSQPVTIPGLSLPAGAKILDLHFWSEHALDQPADGADAAISLKQFKLIMASFKAIGARLQTDPRLEGVQAVHAITPLFFQEDSDAGRHMLARLGFTVVPYRNPMGAFGAFWQDLHIWLLTWAIKPEVLGRRAYFKNLWNELWFPAEAFMRKYGQKNPKRRGSAAPE